MTLGEDMGNGTVVGVRMMIIKEGRGLIPEDAGEVGAGAEVGVGAMVIGIGMSL
jgi:hypothetical protein